MDYSNVIKDDDHLIELMHATLPTASGLMTLSDARRTLAARAFSGSTACPCCGRHDMVYIRVFSFRMARFLIELVGKFAEEERWYHKSELGVEGGGDYAKIDLWDLGVNKPNANNTAKRNTGYWQPTTAGTLFVLGAITIPKHAYVFHSKLLGYSEKQLTVQEALKNKFNYSELMSSAGLL